MWVYALQETLTSSTTQVEAVKGLLSRVLPEHAAKFVLSIPETSGEDGGAYFDVRVHDGSIEVVGTSGVELAAGIHWFLKYRYGQTGIHQVTRGYFCQRRLQGNAAMTSE